MERKYWGIHRSTLHKMNKRAKMAYYAATDNPSLPSTSFVEKEPSPEPQMPHLSPEVSIGRCYKRMLLDGIDQDQLADESPNPFSGKCFLTDLREFCLRFQMPQAALKGLCQFLRQYHPEVPKDPRTLLQTPRTCMSESLTNGNYVHLGLKRGLTDELQLRPSALLPKMQMYSVVQFVCDDSVAVAAKSWFVGDQLVAWPRDREMQRLLEANRRPTDGAKLYEVKVLKDGLDLGKARRLARKAEDTDNLSSSEPAALGRGMRTKYPRILTSDSEDENDIDDLQGNTRGRLGPWPVPPAALRPINDNMPGPSHIETTRQPNENLPPERQLLQEIKQELMSLRKKVDFLSEKAILSDSNFKDMKAMLADTRRALQTVSFVSKEKPLVIQLPLRTSEDYDEFVSKVGTDREIFEETVKHLSTVGGRTEKEFIRNLLASLMGAPLCQSFCWSGSTEKKSFIGSPLFSVLKDAIRNNSQYRGSHPEIIRQTTIEWFHGTRDRYGGRAKRRRTADMGTLESSLSSHDYSVSISEDTEPAVDDNYRLPNTGL